MLISTRWDAVVSTSKIDDLVTTVRKEATTPLVKKLHTHPPVLASRETSYSGLQKLGQLIETIG
jgi:hypothetical protein